MSYRVDIATTARAACQATRCKHEGIKIQKGELRQAVGVMFNEHQSFKYRHWGCVTPTVFHNWWEKADQDLELIDGFEELPEDAKAKVQRALEQGHVDDDDWNGDEGYNRYNPDKPMQGMYAKVSKKKQAEEDDEEQNDSPQKKKPVKKRSHDDDGDEKPAKKAKSKVKKEDVDDDEASAPAKKVKKTKTDNTAEEQPAPKKRQSKGKAAQAEAGLDDVDEAPAKKTARGKKVKAEIEEPVEPVSKSRSRKAKIEADDSVADEPKPGPKRKSRKAAS